MSQGNGATTAAEESFVLNADDLTLADCIDIEELTGQPAFAAFAAASKGEMSAKAMAALVWVTKRKTDPTFTFEDAKAVKVASLSQGE